MDRAEPRCPHCGSILRVDARRIVARALLAAAAFIGWFWLRLRRPAGWCGECRRACDDL